MDFRYIIMVAISGGDGVVGVVTQPVLKIRLVASSRPENVFLFFMWYLKSQNFQCGILPATKDGEYIGVSHFLGVYDIWKAKHVQCDILPASNDGEHSGVSLFSGDYILPNHHLFN